MILKVTGMILLIAACFAVGFYRGTAHTAKERGDRSYLWSMIECEESDEAATDYLYDAYLHVLQGRTLEPLMTTAPASPVSFPASKASVGKDYIDAGVAFYVSPNSLRGFSMRFPKETLELRGKTYFLKEKLVLAKQEFKSELHLIELKRPNQSLQPTAPSGRG